MVTTCDHLERAHGLGAGAIHVEIQVETPTSILLADVSAAVAR